MRIIAGSARGRKIVTPEGRNTRPTSDRVKESVFGIIHFKLPGTQVLDLFAGSGSLGLESLSRGAIRCIFVDKDSECIQAISKNALNLGFESSCEILRSDYTRALRLLSGRGMKFDLVFLDPPYAAGLYREAVEFIVKEGLLNHDGIIIAEHAAKQDDWANPELYTVYDVRTYGSTSVSFIRKAQI